VAVGLFVVRAVDLRLRRAMDTTALSPKTVIKQDELKNEAQISMSEHQVENLLMEGTLSLLCNFHVF
jgi:hypothetical protein